MASLAIFGWLFIVCVLVHQFRVARSRYTFALRMTHGKRRVYVRSRKTGRVVMQTRNVFDVLSLGI